MEPMLSLVTEGFYHLKGFIKLDPQDFDFADASKSYRKVYNHPGVWTIFADVIRGAVGAVECVGIGSWVNSDIGTMEWHSDGIEGIDYTMMYYFDDTDPAVGGSISFKVGDEAHTIYPRSGDIILINQSNRCQHKVEQCKSIRRVIGIDVRRCRL